MKRAEKIENVEALTDDFAKASVTVLAEYRGLTAGQMNKLRRVVREADGRCRVAKNRLAKRAIDGGRYAKLGDLLTGPTARIIGFMAPIAFAKLAVKLADEMPKLALQGAVLDGEVMAPAAVKALAELPPKEVVLAQLLGLIQAPASQLVRTLNEPGARLARLVDALAKRAEGGAA
jgi:large subunit ribosomal protein L10